MEGPGPCELGFPYFFVGTFIEAYRVDWNRYTVAEFPYFFVGTFIEAVAGVVSGIAEMPISLLFRRDFH